MSPEQKSSTAQRIRTIVSIAGNITTHALLAMEYLSSDNDPNGTEMEIRQMERTLVDLLGLQGRLYEDLVRWNTAESKTEEESAS